MKKAIFALLLDIIGDIYGLVKKEGNICQDLANLLLYKVGI